MTGISNSKIRIQILLSTFNGAAYLREQIESFRSIGEFAAYSVLIRDDGSSDETCSILREYEAQENICVVYGENIGLNRSYQWLVEHCDSDCDLYAVSDQDDVWLPEKMKLASASMESFLRTDEPVMYCSRSTVVDSDLHPLYESAPLQKPAGFFNAMIQNPCPGHTQVWNRPLLACLRKYFSKDAVAYDWWVYLIASAFGKVVCSDACTVLHRQHQTNTVGYEMSKAKLFLQRMRRVLNGDGRRVARQLSELLVCTGAKLPDDYRKECEKFLAGQTSPFKRLQYIFTCRVYRQHWSDSVLFRGLYLLNGYKLPEQ